jgi:hypothetical protein
MIVRPNSSQTDVKRLKAFERRILRRIYGPTMGGNEDKLIFINYTNHLILSNIYKHVEIDGFCTKTE